MFVILYLLEEGDFMCVSFKFKDSIKDNLVNISGKRFSDYGMMWGRLSEITRIDLEILQRYDDWYILDDGFYYFKCHSIFEELFMSELSHECNVRCVEFKIAENNLMNEYPFKALGIMSKLYRNRDNNYYEYSDFCKKYFNHIPNNLMVFKLASSIAFGEDKSQKLMEDIYNLITFDIFSGQWDREEHNFFFECSDNGVRIAPLCDNGMIFDKKLTYHSPFGDFSLSDINNNESFRKNLLFLIDNERMFCEKFAYLLDIDINEVLKRTIDKYRIIMNIDEQRKILDYFDDRKSAVEYTLKLSKKNR